MSMACTSSYQQCVWCALFRFTYLTPPSGVQGEFADATRLVQSTWHIVHRQLLMQHIIMFTSCDRSVLWGDGFASRLDVSASPLAEFLVHESLIEFVRSCRDQERFLTTANF